MSMSESKSRRHARNTILSELHPALITFSKEEFDSLKQLMKTSLVVTEAICIRIEEIKLETKTRTILLTYKNEKNKYYRGKCNERLNLYFIF